MWNNKKKAVTFSFDDGVVQDKKCIEILDKYNLKGTFNLNSAYLGLTCERTSFAKDGDGEIIETFGKTCYKKTVKKPHVLPSEIKEIYKNHEIAGHTITHFNLTTLDKETIIYQVNQDKRILEELSGQKIVGMAYPCGGTNSNEEVAEIIKNNTEIKYARTNKQSFNFELPKNPLLLDMTAHYADHKKLMELAREFVEIETDKPICFSIWGHTYEMDDYYGPWEEFEEFCKFISNRDDIFYGTNAQVYLDK